MYEYYNQVMDAYIKIFKKIGFEVKIVESSGGVFTDKNSHEFQVLSDVGEDTIYYCDSCDFAKNKEIFKGQEGDDCSKCNNGHIKTSKSIEVGNIFPLGTKYSQSQKVFYTDKDGKQKPIWLASYGIGPTRVLGTIAEVYHDDNGLIFPKSVSPFDVHLISLGKNEEAQKIHDQLEKEGMEVLYDDREVNAGEKFATSDLIGIPVRLVVSEKTGDKIEFKQRNNKESELLTIEEVLKKLK